MFLVGIFSFLLVIGGKTVHAQHIRLDDAVRNAVEELSSGVQGDIRLAVLSIEANSDRMSTYLIDELISAFVGMRRFTVVSRSQLDLLSEELHFSMSGLVDDATAQSIGRFMGVHFIVTGAFEPLGDFFRFRTQIIEVETAAIRGVYTANVQNDTVIASLLGEAGVPVRIVTPRTPRAPDFSNRFSGELSLVGLGLRYEWDIHDMFSLGVSIFYDRSLLAFDRASDSWSEAIGVSAAARFFPGGSPFYVEIGIGFGAIIGSDGYDSIDASGLMVTPAIGARLGRSFFVNPFISLSAVFGEELWFHPRFGVGLGWAW